MTFTVAPVDTELGTSPAIPLHCKASATGYVHLPSEAIALGLSN